MEKIIKSTLIWLILLSSKAFSVEIQKKAFSSSLSPQPGRHSIHLGVGAPKLNGKLRGYDSAYGKPGPMIEFRYHHFFGQGKIQGGIGTSFGWSRDTGKTFSLNQSNTASLEEPRMSARGKSDLTLMPLAGYLTLQYTPFAEEWVRVQGWVGRELMYVEESRRQKGEKLPHTALWHEGDRFGGAIHFRIDQFDSRSSSSLHILDLEKIFLSPFIEWVTNPSSRHLMKGSRAGFFNRQVIGLLLTFSARP